MEDKKKLYGTLLGVSVFALVIVGLSVAWLVWRSTNTNISINSDCFAINYSKGQDISNAKLKLLNENDIISDNNITITTGMALTTASIGIDSSCNIEGYGILKLNVNTLSDAFTTGDSVGSLKYTVVSYNPSTYPDVTVDALNSVSFTILSKGSITSTGTKEILVEELSNSTVNNYIIIIYIDGSKAGNDVIGSTFSGTISAEAMQGKINADYTLQRLNSLNSTIAVDTTHTPDFTTVSGNNGQDNNGNTGLGDSTKGIYASEDDLGVSYYFRGAVENNYVKFTSSTDNSSTSKALSASLNKHVATKLKVVQTPDPYSGGDMYFRIIRINGDGTIRMIFAGSEPYANGTSDQDSYIGTSSFNAYPEDNAYVGYMYGTSSSPTYAETHANTNNSTIKEYMDNWYLNNLNDYTYAIADAIYCNDRSVTPVDSFNGMTLTGTGIGTENTAYSSLTRNYINHTPSLKCTNYNDRFTVNSSIGNGALTYPVGLITLDEAVVAGGLAYDVNTSSFITNTDYYLYTGYLLYWTMTPVDFSDGNASVGFAYVYGVLNNGGVYGSYGVRPVVSLRSDAISGGSGTMTDPFVVG